MAEAIERESGGEDRSWWVRGMDCPSCVAKVERAVSRIPGLQAVSVDLMAETMTARFGLGADPAAVVRAVEALGYKASPRIQRAAVEPAGYDHAATCTLDHGHQYDAAPVDAGDDGRDRAAASLYHAHAEGDVAPSGPWWRTGKAKLVCLLGGLVALAWIGSWFFAAEAYWIFVAATLIAVFPFSRRALALASAGSPFSIETLMSVAALGAVAIGAAEEAAIVVLLFAAGELLESVAAGRARAGIQGLADLMPPTARVERNRSVIEVDAATLRVGEVVQVRPGDRIPCDGYVLDGQSSVDESPVTGESVPVARGPGDVVVAASVNTSALLRLRVTATASDNTISRIVRLVQEATASRAPTQTFIEKFSTYWTPGAMCVSALAILVLPLAFGTDWWTSVYRGLSVLLIACPCALVISVPAAMASGLSAGARRGLLIKGGAALETIGSVATVAFDKTGTLTKGRPCVTDILPLSGTEVTTLLRAAAAVEAGSAHPLARAVLEAAQAHGINAPIGTEAGAVPGKAATALVEGQRISVGSPRHAEELGAVPSNSVAVADLEEAGKTVVVVLADNRPLGILAFRDELREDAASAIEALKRMHLTNVMLTGDNERTGRAIAASLRMDVCAQLLPEQKLHEIEKLKRRGHVAMVGDGINDAPALAAASVGIAMGGGTAVALETADAALLHERVSGIAELIALSRATMANVKQNVAIAVGLKLVFLLTTLMGVTGLWMAILADTGATVLVTVNALRLLSWHSPVGGTPRAPNDH